MLRWLWAAITSFGMPVVSGRRSILTGIEAGEARGGAKHQRGGRPCRHASRFGPGRLSEVSSQSGPCGSPRSTHHCEAVAIACATSARMIPPLSRVDGPEALTIVPMRTRR